jgi:hypothetical protein
MGDGGWGGWEMMAMGEGEASCALRGENTTGDRRPARRPTPDRRRTAGCLPYTLYFLAWLAFLYKLMQAQARCWCWQCWANAARSGEGRPPRNPNTCPGGPWRVPVLGPASPEVAFPLRATTPHLSLLPSPHTEWAVHCAEALHYHHYFQWCCAGSLGPYTSHTSHTSHTHTHREPQVAAIHTPPAPP